MNKINDDSERSLSNFSAWAAQVYNAKKEAVDFLENSFDPFDQAIGTLIKKYAGCEQNDI